MDFRSSARRELRLPPPDGAVAPGPRRSGPFRLRRSPPDPAAALLFALEDDGRHRHAALVGERQVRAQDAAIGQGFLERLGKAQLRLARGLVDHPDAVPVGRRLDARAQGLGEGLFGGKALRQIRGRLAMREKPFQLGLAQHALGEPLAETLERVLDPADLDQVGADPEDHRAACNMRAFISRTASRMPTNTARDTIAWPMCSSRTPGSRATGSTLK